jgi:hypothetical protein
MNKITLKYENSEYFLEIVNSINDTLITRIRMSKVEIANLYASLSYYIN